MPTSPEDAPTIARLCEEITTLTSQLERYQLVFEEQDILRRSERAKLKEELDETHKLFRAERAGLYKRLSISADEIDQLRNDHKREVIFLRGEFGEQIVALETQLLHERSEREAAQRTIAILGGGLDPEPEELTCANEKCGKKSTKRRGNQLYCSSRCKSAAGVRRHRASIGGGES